MSQHPSDSTQPPDPDRELRQPDQHERDPRRSSGSDPGHRSPSSDATMERFRRGLDEFAAGVGDDPPDLRNPSVIPTPAPVRDHRRRWIAAAAAAAVVAAGAGILAWAGDDASPPTDTARSGATTERDGASPLAVIPEVFLDGPGGIRRAWGLHLEAELHVEDGCLVFVEDNGARSVPLWADGTEWQSEPPSVVLPDGTVIPVGAQVLASGGAGSPRDDQMPDITECVSAVGSGQPDHDRGGTRTWYHVSDATVHRVPPGALIMEPDGLVTEPEPINAIVDEPVEGRVVVNRQCVWLEDETGVLMATIWPHGATWDGPTSSVVLPDGTAIPLGSSISANGVRGNTRGLVRDIPVLDRCASADLSWYPYGDEAIRFMSDITITDQPPPSSTPPPTHSDTIGSGGQPTIRQVATVMDSADHGPRLCWGFHFESRWPSGRSCGGADIVNWDWSTVEFEEEGRTRQGKYVVVGRYNAARTEFSLSEPAREATDDDAVPLRPSDQDVPTPCDEPSGGWDVETPRDSRALNRRWLRRNIDGFAGTWVDPASGVHTIQIAGNEGDVALAEAKISDRFTVRLCVNQVTHTGRELGDIRRGLPRHHPPAAVTWRVDVPTNTVRLSMWMPAPEVETELRELFGDAVSFEYLFDVVDE